MADKGMGRYVPLTGLLFVVVAVVGILVGGAPPGASDDAAKVVEFWRDNDTKEIISSAIFALAAVPLVFFAGSLRSVMRSKEGPTGGWSSVTFGGFVILGAGVLVGAGIAFATADAASDIGPGAIVALNVLNAELFFPFTGGIAIAFLGFAISEFRVGTFPAWLRWVALIIAVVAFTPGGFFALIASLIWIVVLSILMFRMQNQPAQQPAQPAG